MIPRGTTLRLLILLPLLTFESNAQVRHKPADTKTLEYLRAKAGFGPWDIWKTQPLHDRLIALIGVEEFQALQRNMDPADSLTISNGVMSSGGNRAHLGGEEEGVLLLDLNNDVIEVLLLHRTGVVRVWAEQDRSVAVPATIQDRLSQWPQVALFQALTVLDHPARAQSNSRRSK